MFFFRHNSTFTDIKDLGTGGQETNSINESTTKFFNPASEYEILQYR